MVNNLVSNRHKPLAYAPISLVEGEQGSGKNVYVCSEAVDATFANATSIKLADGHEFKCSPVLDDGGYPIIGKVKVHLSTKDLIVKCPAGSCVIAEDVRVYANFHFYGIRAAYFTLAQIIEHLNDGTIGFGYLYLDEHYMGGNAREGMSTVVRAITKLTNQMRKKHIHLTYLTPHARQIDWLERSSVRKRVFCESYDEETHMCTYTVQEKGVRGTRTKQYYAATYFKYYWTDEQISMGETAVGKAILAAQ
jgi:hypothetical protein